MAVVCNLLNRLWMDANLLCLHYFSISLIKGFGKEAEVILKLIFCYQYFEFENDLFLISIL